MKITKTVGKSQAKASQNELRSPKVSQRDPYPHVVIMATPINVCSQVAFRLPIFPLW